MGKALGSIPSTNRGRGRMRKKAEEEITTTTEERDWHYLVKLRKAPPHLFIIQPPGSGSEEMYT